LFRFSWFYTATFERSVINYELTVRKHLRCASPVVTICTICCNIKSRFILPTRRIYVFCVDLRTAIISLYSINWLVFIMDTDGVLCEVGTEVLYFIWMNVQSQEV
jgi:hypothetical protein